MHKINVIIGLTSNDMLWHALIKFLQDVPDINLEQTDNHFRLQQVLSSQDSNVLILEKQSDYVESDYLNYFELNPRLGIIVIDPVGADTLIHLSNAGCNQLVELIRTLGQGSAEKPSRIDERLYHLSIKDQTDTADAIVTDIGEYLPNTNPPLHFEDICEWLDLTLLIYFKSLNRASNETNVPGWAMSAEHAQSLLCQKFASLPQQEVIELRNQVEAKIENQSNAAYKVSSSSRFIQLLRTFNLHQIEAKIIMLVLAPELDDRYARIYGYINDDLTQKRPSVSTIRQLLFDQSKYAYDVSRVLRYPEPLGRFRIIYSDASDLIPQSIKGLKLGEQVLKFLFCPPSNTPDYSNHLQLFESSQVAIPKRSSANESLHQKLSTWQTVLDQNRSAPVIQLLGEEACLKWFKQEVFAHKDNVLIFKPIHGDAQQLSLQEQFDSAIQISLLHKAILIVSNLDNKLKSELQHHYELLIHQVVENVPELVLHSRDILKLNGSREIWVIEPQPLDFNTRTQLWRDKAKFVHINLTASNAALLASTIRFDEPEIEKALALCPNDLNDDEQLKEIQAATRKVAQQMVPKTVNRLKATFGWEDIVLPENTLASLRQISGHIRYAGQVFENWGYRSRIPFGSGAAVLFNGPSGTGKTMAAQIIAKELGVELFQIDLANTVSKYIGETEKNLRTIFDAAERASAVLLFDEADALFGKRTEVKDAHDRYANVEVAYLLQRMEAYSGLAILTTNLKRNLDSAFLRRLRFVIDFPMPSAKHREAIWSCVFPKQVKFSDDVDFRFLARRLQLSGGHIQQIAIRSAFAAVAESDRVHMKHIVQATREELIKLGMLDSERSLNDWTPKLVGGAAS